MSFRMKELAAAIASVSALVLAPQAMTKDFESEMIIIHPFQWTYDNIAKECTEYLGPAGFDGVQISQPAEHINRDDVWWAVYQPVNFKNFTTMTGNEQQLKAMVKACNDAGVKVFADAVFNQRGNTGNTGYGGSGFNSGAFQYPDLDSSDFHHNNCQISNYGDANHVRTCALSSMPDLATDSDQTQGKIADYIASLMEMGIYGVRVDAAKHMGYTDLESIFQKVKAKAGKRPPAYYEVIGSYGEAADIQPDKYMNNDNTVVTDFTYVNNVAAAFSGDFGKALSLGGSYGSDNVEVFVNNHDDEAGRCSAGTCSMGTRNNPNYNLAQSWMVVWPFGKVRQVYSGYEFSSHDPAGPIKSAPNRCEGGWLCQHRVPMVLNAPRFARATRDQAVTTKGYENDALWINRGSKGFYVQNTSNNEFTRTFKVEVPDGVYCDILGQVDPCGGNKITVSGGAATFTVKGKSAAAICVGEWCGEQKDPCETDPTGASCLCKDDADKQTCTSFCSTTGKDDAACICKDEGTDKNGVCTSYCELNPREENCYCVLNPDADECQIRYEQTKKGLCYVGSSNSWKQEKMTFSANTGLWTLTLTLDGKGDDGGKQRFKITDGCAWNSAGGTEYGNASNGVLQKVTSEGDVFDDHVGNYVLQIEDATMKYKFVEVKANNKPEAAFTSSASGLAVKFTDASSDKDGDKLTYSWDFGDSSTKSTETNPSHTYAKAGTYSVTLTVSDGKESASATNSVTVDENPDAVYKKVAIRTSEDNYGTTMMQSQGNNIWTITNLVFSKDGNFKIEALPGDQCVIIGGALGKPLTASGDFIGVAAGKYDVTFDASTNTVTMKKVEENQCTDPKCGTQCNKGTDCVDGVCQGADCAYEEIQDEDLTKTNCSTDGTTTNCETSSYAYTFLGADYSKESTVFRLWSPDSSNVSVEVDGKSYPMTKANVEGYSDVYEATVQGDLDQKAYQFKVNGNAVRDPYGKMVVPATYSGSDGVGVSASDNRNVVMNMRATDLKEGWAPRPVFKNREDAVIYEVHVRDFTVDKSSGVSDAKRGRYLGMVETGTKSSDGLATGIDHLKELGVTHVQLLPVYDYGSCSDVDSQSDSCYNWGYDPVNFNVPEDRYTSVFKSEKYLQKVQEFKEMVNEFHKNGIRVIMDVVYNHTYNKEMFSNITSKYYTSTDLSGCGNSVDAKQAMVSRFIRDSLEYWATEYNIDGFRFDLVGIFDVNDFKNWGEYLNGKYPGRNFLMYGEPWNGYATDPSEGTRVRLGTIRNAVSGHVGVFNGKFRECVKGSSDDAVGGFMFNSTYHDLGSGVSNNVECVSAGVKGGIGDNTNMWTPLFAADPEQSINYLTAHDNLTLMDKIAKVANSTTSEYAKRLQAYGNGIVLVSQGIPFIHAGSEFGRSKNGDKNSYKTPGDVNNIKWGLKKTNNGIFEYYKGMIAMRKAHPAFRFTTKSEIEANVKTYGQSGAVVVDINGAAAGDSWKNIKMVINSGDNLTISGVDGWKKKVNGVTVNTDGATGNSTAEGTAVTVWYQE